MSNQTSDQNKTNPSLYEFNYSKVSNSNSSHNTSKISNYGMEGYGLPEPVRKPGFNFKKSEDLRKARIQKEDEINVFANVL